MNPVRLLFVCLGNICRSPLAEVVVRGVAEKRGIADSYHFASAGTGSWHVGGGADHRSEATAKEHALDLSGHRAQQIRADNIDRWHWFVAMDRNNRDDLLAMGVAEDRILMMRQFEVDGGSIPDVPDPYFGGPDGFEDVYFMLCENADRILDHLEQQISS